MGTPASAWKLTVDCPEVAVTVAGTVNKELLALTLMLKALEGARLRLITQLALELGDSTVGLQDNELTSMFALKDSEALTSMPLASAVIDAMPSKVEAATVAAKPALVDPDATFTLAGTDTFELLLARVTVKPVPGAGPVSDTVQVADPGELTADGEQFIELSWIDPATVIVVF